MGRGQYRYHHAHDGDQDDNADRHDHAEMRTIPKRALGNFADFGLTYG